MHYSFLSGVFRTDRMRRRGRKMKKSTGERKTEREREREEGERNLLATTRCAAL